MFDISSTRMLSNLNRSRILLPGKTIIPYKYFTKNVEDKTSVDYPILSHNRSIANIITLECKQLSHSTFWIIPPLTGPTNFKDLLGVRVLKGPLTYYQWINITSFKKGHSLFYTLPKNYVFRQLSTKFGSRVAKLLAFNLFTNDSLPSLVPQLVNNWPFPNGKF